MHTMVSGWTQDDCHDPSHRVCVIDVDGKAYEAHKTYSTSPFTTFSALPYDGRRWCDTSVENFVAQLALYPEGGR